MKSTLRFNLLTFSGAGSSYAIATTESTVDEDWDF